MNELEERRVMRLLAGAADAIPPLPDAEARSFVRGVAARAPAWRRRSRARGRHVLSVTALAAAMALAVLLPSSGRESEERLDRTSTTAAGYLAPFPEGSALQLLLSQKGPEHA